jgi:hypothetical protein
MANEQHNSTGPSVQPEVEVNVVMGAQTRAIVRSALLHVRKAVHDRSDIEDESQAVMLDLIDAELVQWPLSVAGEPEDTLPAWLWNRFAYGMGKVRESRDGWTAQPEDEKLFWEHEAAAVRRAVGRGGFKTSPDEVEIATPTSELHQAAANSGNMVKGYFQLDLKNAESLGEAIRIAVGAASMCWANVNQAGTYRPEWALDIATQLEHHFMYLLQLMSGQTGERHRALAEKLQIYSRSGHEVVSIRQVMDILAGRTTPIEYGSALQPQPRGEVERYGRG